MGLFIHFGQVKDKCIKSLEFDGTELVLSVGI